MQRAAKRARKASGGTPKRRRHRNPKNPSRKQSAASRKNVEKARSAKRRKKACRRAYGKRGAAKRHGKKRLPGIPKRCKTPKRKAARRRKKAAHKTSGHRKSAKHVRAGKKAAATRKRHKRSKSKGHKVTGHRKSRKRVLAGRKGAATRRSNRRSKTYDSWKQESEMTAYESPRRKRRKGKRRGRKHNPIANPIRHRRHMRRHRNPFFGNPLEGPMEVVAGLFGVGSGYAVADLVDRMLATHPLAPAGSGFTDTPAAGQIYDSEAPLLPIWSDPIRLAAAVGIIFTPGLASRFVKNAKFKAFLQLAAYGAGARVAGKAMGDALATFGSSNQYVLQAYAPEVAAQARQMQVGSGVIVPMVAGAAGSSAQQPAGMFAGPPKGARQLGAANTGVGGCSGGCGGGCNDCQQSSMPIVTANDVSPQHFIADSSSSSGLGGDSGGYYGNEAGGYGNGNGAYGSGDCNDCDYQNDCPQAPVPSYTSPAPVIVPVVVPVDNSGGGSSSGGNTQSTCPPGMVQLPDGTCVYGGPDARLTQNGGGGGGGGGGTTTTTTTTQNCPPGTIFIPGSGCQPIGPPPAAAAPVPFKLTGPR